MIDTATKKPLRVLPSTVGPYIRVPFTQLDEVRRVLDSSHIRYRVQENVLSFNGGPEIAIVDLDREADVAAIQAILDSTC